MKKTLAITLAVVVFMLGGCVAQPPVPPTRTQINAGDYGVVPSDYQPQVMAFLGRGFKDPDSAQYKFGKPLKAYFQDDVAHGSGVVYGWIFPVAVNAKNSYGGYVGYKDYVWGYINVPVGDQSGYVDPSNLRGGYFRIVD
jgi:hypothetical protein